MTARLKLVLSFGGALALASIATFAAASALGIYTSGDAGHRRYGEAAASLRATLAGSSLTYDGVDWREVAAALGGAVESWPVPGSSPAEWEQVLKGAAGAGPTFVGVSLYDLNEAWLCDFRANIVPVGQTVTDLRASHSDMAFARRVLKSYPLAWARTVFPTAGRADRVIFGLRDKARSLFRMDPAAADRTQLRLAGDYTSEERLSDWPEDRLLRRLASMRSVQGTPGFFGPKHLALKRLLQTASRRGEVIVIVLPVSVVYIENLLGASELQAFEDSLSATRAAVPEARWVRLDRLEALRSTDHFYDLVHLNMQGRRIATDELLRTLAATSARR